VRVGSILPPSCFEVACAHPFPFPHPAPRFLKNHNDTQKALPDHSPTSFHSGGLSSSFPRLPYSLAAIEAILFPSVFFLSPPPFQAHSLPMSFHEASQSPALLGNFRSQLFSPPALYGLRHRLPLKLRYVRSTVYFPSHPLFFAPPLLNPIPCEAMNSLCRPFP